MSPLAIIVFFFEGINLPLNLNFPSFNNLLGISLQVFLLCILIGLIMLMSLINLFKSLSQADAADVLPIIYSISTIFTILLELIFFNVSYKLVNFLGLIFLVLGMLLFSNIKFNNSVFLNNVLAGLFFGLYYFLNKYLFNLLNFDSGFLYTRISVFFVALLFILIPRFRKKIFIRNKSKKINNLYLKSLLITSSLKILSGTASILILKSIYLGSVSVVQAISGVQFIILIFFRLLLGINLSTHFGENDISKKIIYKKLIASIVVTFGLFFTFL